MEITSKPRKCMMVLCGLPAAGKTTFLREMKSQCSLTYPEMSIDSVIYDDIYKERLQVSRVF